MAVGLRFVVFMGLVVAVLCQPVSVMAADGDFDAERRFQKNLERARNGDMMAQHKLAAMYEQGNGVSKDLTMAFKWYQRSAKQGNIKAEYQVGFMYFVGKGVDQDLPQAKAILEKVANKGYVAGQYMLGHMYEKGVGVSRDLNKAQQWYVRAANSGYLNAKYALKKLDEDATKSGDKSPAPAVAAGGAASLPGSSAARLANRLASNRTPTPSVKPAPTPKPSKKSAPEDVAMLATPVKKKPSRFSEASLPNASSLSGNRRTSIYREPEIIRRKINVKDLIRTVMGNFWLDSRKPARMLPSDKTSCKALKDGTIECLSDRLERKLDDATIIYQTRTVLSDISQMGEFTLTYRNNVLNVIEPKKSDGFWDDATMPVRLGWQDTQHELQCVLGDGNADIRCVKDTMSMKVFTKAGKKVKLSKKSKKRKR